MNLLLSLIIGSAATLLLVGFVYGLERLQDWIRDAMIETPIEVTVTALGFLIIVLIVWCSIPV